MRAEMSGRFAEAERLAFESFGHARRANVYDAPRALGAQLLMIRTAQGRVTEIEGGLRESLAAYPDDAAYPALYSVVLAEFGRTEEARERFARFVDAYDPRCDQNRGVTVTILATACEPLGDAARAGRLYDAFLPEADRIVTNVSAWICMGSLHWPLGKLAHARGDAAAAERHFAEAARRNEDIGAVGYLVSTWFDHAQLCAERGELGRARELARAVRERAACIGLEPLRARSEELLQRF
jgi:tetratricopeptide (TPR) repeat protein